MSVSESSGIAEYVKANRIAQKEKKALEARRLARLDVGQAV